MQWMRVRSLVRELRSHLLWGNLAHVPHPESQRDALKTQHGQKEKNSRNKTPKPSPQAWREAEERCQGCCLSCWSVLGVAEWSLVRTRSWRLPWLSLGGRERKSQKERWFIILRTAHSGRSFFQDQRWGPSLLGFGALVRRLITKVYKFLRRQVMWSGSSVSLRTFQFVVIHTKALL